MADLIDRQAAIDALDSLCDIVCQYSKKQRSVMCGACPLGSAFDTIEELPSADAVKVVRCKDCTNSYLHKAWDEEEPRRYCRNLRNAWAKDYDLCVEDDDFCKYGVRKE